MSTHNVCFCEETKININIFFKKGALSGAMPNGTQEKSVHKGSMVRTLAVQCWCHFLQKWFQHVSWLQIRGLSRAQLFKALLA